MISQNDAKENPGDYPVYSSQTANFGEFARINTYDWDGEYITWTTDGAYAGTVFYRNGKFSITNVCGLIQVRPEWKDKIHLKYLYYYLNKVAKNYVNRIVSNPKLMSNVVEDIEIPIPPLDIQHRIGDFLFQFEEFITSKTLGIPKEIELRKEQLNFYLSKLTQHPKSQIKIVKLQDVASYISDKISTKELDISNYISVENLLQDLAGKIDSPNVPENQRVNAYQEQDILLGNINPYLHKIWFATHAGGCNQDVLIIRPHTPAILPKYLFFVLCAPEFWHYNDRFTRKGALTRGDKQQIMQYEFSLPSIEEQEKTIRFLDKLYELTFDSQAGLETMRKLRSQQLDYYLNKFF